MSGPFPPSPDYGYGGSLVGRVLSGTYRLVDLVGTGASAEVYLARDVRTNETVAVKVLHGHIARQPGLTQRFVAESEVARRLTGPNLVRSLGAGQDSGLPPYFVMEYVQGLALAEIIRRRGPLPIPEAVRIVDQILAALVEAHGLGIVHRDIKPANIMLRGDGLVKVMDFGIAKVLDRGAMTQAGEVLGTPAYMAPEQITGERIDHRADIYATGLILYELLSGRSPIGTDTDARVAFQRILHGQPEPIQRVRQDVPPALAAVIDRALAKAPDQRFQTAYEMRQALQSAIAPASGTQQMPTGPMAPAPLPHTPPPTTPLPTAPLPGPSMSPHMPPPHMPPPQMPRAPMPPSGVSQPGMPPSQFPPTQNWQIPAPPPSSSSSFNSLVSKPAFIIPVAALALLLVGIGAGVVVPRILATPATPTPTVAVALATATIPPTAPPTAPPTVPPTAPPTVPPTAPPTVAPTTAPTVPPTPPPPPVAVQPTSTPVYRADFDRNYGNMPSNRGSGLSYESLFWEGEYAIKIVDVARSTGAWSYLPGTWGDAIMSVTGYVVGGVDYGHLRLGCRITNTQAQQLTGYWAWVQTTPPGVRIFRYDQGNPVLLVPSTTSPEIRRGAEKNRIEMSCVGDTISLRVNGNPQPVVSVQDGTYREGSFAIGVGTFNDVRGNAEARFDDLEVRRP